MDGNGVVGILAVATAVELGFDAPKIIVVDEVVGLDVGRGKGGWVEGKVAIIAMVS